MSNTYAVRVDDAGNVVDVPIGVPLGSPDPGALSRDLRAWAVGKAVEIVNNPARASQQDAQLATATVLSIAKQLHTYVMGGQDGGATEG